MNRRWILAVGLVLVIASSLAAREPAPHYEFELQRTETGFALKCRTGCNWVTLTGNCDGDQPNCRFIVDERGIKVLPHQ